MNIKDVNGAKNLLNFKMDDLDGLKDHMKGKSFGKILTEKITEVNDVQIEANHAIEKLVSGRSKNIHETMIAVEKAEIAFKMMNQIRLKVIDAYKEIMKMQV